MNELVKYYPEKHILIDTYASLLYKIGKTTNAINWEEKASKLSPNKDYVIALEQMKKGEPTYKIIPLWYEAAK